MSIDLDSAPFRTERVHSGLREHKRRTRWRRVGVASVVAAALIVGANLYFSPAHTYDRNAHQAAWLAAVQSIHGKNGCSSPSSAISNLAGVGQVTLVCVARSGQKILTAIFWKTSGQEGAGLAYGSPPYDTCVTPLGGSWWQIGPFDPRAMSCQRGFTFTPGP
jgi:hypothetical protein